MHVRGRLSAEGAAAQLLQLPIARPEPPREMTLMQAALWREITAGLPPGFFRAETIPMLAAYVRHCVTQKYIAKARSKLEEQGKLTPKYFKLLGDEMKLSALMRNLATSMRLTQQSTYDRKNVIKKGVVPLDEPWADED